MAWVVKIPKRRDFCGCPGCPLCYDWVEEFKAPSGEVKEVLLTGVELMARDLLKREPTLPEKKALEESAEKIHIANLNRQQTIDEEFREADQKKSLEMQLKYVAKEKNRREVRPPKPKVDTRPVCDHIEIKEPKGKKTEKEKEAAEVDRIDRSLRTMLKLDAETRAVQERMLAATSNVERRFWQRKLEKLQQEKYTYLQTKV